MRRPLMVLVIVAAALGNPSVNTMTIIEPPAPRAARHAHADIDSARGVPCVSWWAAGLFRQGKAQKLLGFEF